MEGKMIYRDDIMVNEKGEYYTAERLAHNDWYRKEHTWTKVEDAYVKCKGKTVRCNYSQIFFPDTSLLLCNNIPEAYPEIYDNLESGELCRYEDSEGNTITYEEYEALQDECKNAYEIYEDIYQWYLIDESTADLLKEHTDNLIFYCEQLDLYVLGVTHFGTSWDYVNTDFIY